MLPGTNVPSSNLSPHRRFLGDVSKDLETMLHFGSNFLLAVKKMHVKHKKMFSRRLGLRMLGSDFEPQPNFFTDEYELDSERKTKIEL